MSSNPPTAKGSVGKGGDPKLPSPYSDTFTALEEREDEPEDTHDPWAEEEEVESWGERLDIWRRKYFPLPDEVVYEFLGEDEYVVHSDHPSFRAFLEQNIALVVLIPIIGPLLVWLFIARRGGDIDLHWGAVVGVFLLLDVIVAFLALRRLGDRYTSYVITNLRLIKVTGIISRKLASIPWTRMTGLGYRQKAVGRVLGYATIFIESANEESGLREFSDVNDPQTFHQRLLDMVSAKSGQSNRLPPAPTVGKRQGFLAARKERKKAASSEAGGSGKVFPRRKATGPAGGGGGSEATRARPKVRGTVKGAGGSVASPKPSEPADSSSQTGPDEPAHGAHELDESETGWPDEYGEYGDIGPEPEAGAGAVDREPSHDEVLDEEGPAPSGPAARSAHRSWLRWPGSEAGVTPPVPSSPGKQKPEEGKESGTPHRRRGPDQRAPSRRPPRTIVVPRSHRPPGPDQPRRGQRGRLDPRWRGRVREVQGYDESQGPSQASETDTGE